MDKSGIGPAGPVRSVGMERGRRPPRLGRGRDRTGDDSLGWLPTIVDPYALWTVGAVTALLPAHDHRSLPLICLSTLWPYRLLVAALAAGAMDGSSLRAGIYAAQFLPAGSIVA
jgi:hypothetical protein